MGGRAWPSLATLRADIHLAATVKERGDVYGNTGVSRYADGVKSEAYDSAAFGYGFEIQHGITTHKYSERIFHSLKRPCSL